MLLCCDHNHQAKDEGNKDKVSQEMFISSRVPGLELNTTAYSLYLLLFNYI